MKLIALILCLLSIPTYVVTRAGPEVSLTNPSVAISQDKLNQQLTDAILAGSVDEVKKTIAAGVDVNFIDSDDKTPISLALLLGKFDIVVELIESGAKGDITYRGKSFAQSALEAAFRRMDPFSIKVIMLLIVNGVDFSQVNWNGNDIREFARQVFNVPGGEGKELIKQLTNRGYKVIDYIWDMTGYDLRFSTDLITFCVKMAIDINKPTGSEKMPALFIVIKASHSHRFDEWQLLENLLNAGANINVVADPNGNGPQTPLDWALSNGASESIRILMQRGAKTYKQLSNK